MITKAQSIAHWLFFNGSVDPGDGIISTDWDEIEREFGVPMTQELVDDIEDELYSHPYILDSEYKFPTDTEAGWIDCNFSTWLCHREQEEWENMTEDYGKLQEKYHKLMHRLSWRCGGNK